MSDKEPICNRVVNKSHAAAYAVISAQTAWLKCYHPVEFWVATLNSVVGKNEKMAKYLYFAQLGGFKVLPPDISKSMYGFSSEDGKIRIGLSAIRNLGKAGEAIIAERESNGPFWSFQDFIDRCHTGKTVIVSIALSGAADRFGYTRKSLSESFEAIAKYKKKKAKDNEQLTMDLGIEDRSFEILEETHLKKPEEFDKKQKLQLEYDYVGMYVSEHPLDDYQAIIQTVKPDLIADLMIDPEDIDNMPKHELNKRIKITGILKEVEHRLTRNGDKMVSGKIEDKTGTIGFAIFNDVLSRPTFNEELLVDGSIVILDGVRRVNDFGSNIMVNAINTLVSHTNTLSAIYCLTDTDHKQDLIDVARSCKTGNLTVAIQVDDAPGQSKLFVIDKNDGSLHATSQKANVKKDRDLKDYRNLKVDFSDYFRLKEASRNIKLG